MKLQFIAFLIILTNTLYGQKEPSAPEPVFYAFDSEWHGTKLNKAVYLMIENKEKDSWRYDSYYLYGPLIKTEHYKDKEGTIAHGKFVYYDTYGKVDSIQYFVDGQRHGNWTYYSDDFKVIMQKTYANGQLEKISDYLNKDTLARRAGLPKDSLKAGEKESEFMGGQASWRRFLGKNFQYPERARERKVQGTVSLQFVVDAEGNIQEPTIIKSVEYSLDQETLRILRISPQWVPAEQGGRKVKSYKRQPITFKLG